MSRTPGTNSAPNVTTAPATPASTRVFWAPTSALTGPVRAKERGSRPIDISQSRLYQLGRDLVAVEPRPQDLLRGIEDARSGTKSRLSDEEMNAALASMRCQTAVPRP